MAWNVECENRFNQYGPASLEGYLGIDWEEWPNMAVFLALVFIFETVAFAYPDNPTEQEQIAAKQFFNSLHFIFVIHSVTGSNDTCTLRCRHVYV